MPRKKKKKLGLQGQILLIGCLITAVVFSSMSILLFIGMIPTIVSAAVDRSKFHLRTWTVGVMNFAGCVPFMLEVWKKGATIELSLNYISQPRTIVVMFAAAAMGYVIDWAVTNLVASVMIQRGKSRQKDIDKQQKDLIQRWGPEITGTIPLDEYGFPKDDPTTEEQTESPASS